MRLCPIVRVDENVKYPVTGQVLLKVNGSDEVQAAADYIDRNFDAVRILVDASALTEDETTTLLNAGAAKVITKHDIAEDRLLKTGATDAKEGDSYVYGSVDQEHSANVTLLVPQSELDAEKVGQVLWKGVTSDRPDGLIATVVCDERESCLGLAYSSRESIAESVRTGNAVYQSRKRGLWYKGATSGDVQQLLRIDCDCDSDTFKFVVRQTGRGFCHLPQYACFGDVAGLGKLERTLIARKQNAPTGSYTHRLFNDEALLQAKIREEAQEVCEAETPKHIAFEAADLIYFALARCVKHGVSLKDIERSLDRKALKVTRRKGDAKPQFQQDSNNKETEKAVEQVKQMGDDPPVDDRESLRLRVFDESLSAKETADLLKRPIKTNDEITGLVKPILQAVRERGDQALLELTAKFDGAKLDSPILRAPFPKSAMQLSAETTAAIDQAFSNIQRFHAAQLENERPISIETMPGVKCSRFSRPIEAVGLYVPGGTAVLPSTAMMLGVPAMVAGCKHIILASPPRRDGSLNPEIVYIAHKVGAEAILLAGGAQAVAALAYGTDSVRKCDKILGPGNQFVTAAKSIVAGYPSALVSIDMPAGPSEVLIIADEKADPAFVASDLLSQAEHGADSQSVLVGVDLSDSAIRAIQEQVIEQANRLPRVDILRKSIAHSYIYNCSTLSAAIDLTNAYAPEHLIVYTTDAERDVDRITNAGSIFVGPYAPVACGDYASGTNHTLPTYGYARQYSGVNTASFLKAMTSQTITKEGLKDLGKVVMQLATVEGLEAHRNSVQVRLA